MIKPLAVDKLPYTPAEAAHALGVSRSTIYVLMANGNVPSVRIGSARRMPTRPPALCRAAEHQGS
jgi:excisionase family DNA binding protein